METLMYYDKNKKLIQEDDVLIFDNDYKARVISYKNELYIDIVYTCISLNEIDLNQCEIEQRTT